MKMKIFLFICLLVPGPLFSASDQSFDLTSSYGSTADHLQLQTHRLDFAKNRKNFLWPYSDQNSKNELGFSLLRTESRVQGLHFSLLEFQASGGWLLAEDHWVKASLGVSHLDSTSQDSLIGRADYQFRWGKDSVSGLFFGYGHMTPVVISLSGAASNMYSQQMGAMTAWNLTEKWQAQIQTRVDYSRDDNQRFWLDGQVMYAFSKFPHWLRLGWGTTYLGYHFPTAQYWSPRRFSAHGPRADLSFQLMDQLSYFLGGSYNLFQENSFSPGQGHYFRTGLNWGDRNRQQLILSFENGESTQNGRLWYSHFYNLSAVIFW